MDYDSLTRETIITRRGYRTDVKGDKFSLYISNYPVNATYLKERIGNTELVLAELCCSIGITLEYLASGFKKIIGVDIDETALAHCMANLKTSNKSRNTALIHGDVFNDTILKKIKADIVIYDVPYWNSFLSENKGNFLDKNPPLDKLVDKIRKYITKEIVIFVPPNYEYEKLAEILDAFEYEKVFINNKHNRTQVYLGNLKRINGITEIKFEV
ncbi:MAG: class I SAM-dependent methyltransferase [Flavobacteriaceae bacterium]|nr:class I SAM-dependent methyltransferase [Flavobacteriaceae bacterium]